MKNEIEEVYWSKRYEEGQTGWDIGYPSTPIKTYFDQVGLDKNKKILIPGAGNAYEAEYLHNQGFTNIHVLDISPLPLADLSSRVPSFPTEHLHQGNFFEHDSKYDLVIEQTFFCSFEPTQENREAYAQQMSSLIKPGGRLIGLWFEIPLSPESKRPFGGSREEYLGYLQPYFEMKVFEPCHNSIRPRMGKELWGNFRRKEV